jgi:hypothetical protein
MSANKTRLPGNEFEMIPTRFACESRLRPANKNKAKVSGYFWRKRSADVQNEANFFPATGKILGGDSE